MITELATESISQACKEERQARYELLLSYITRIKKKTKATSKKSGPSNAISDAEIAAAMGLHVQKRSNTINTWKINPDRRVSDPNMATLRLLASGSLVLIETGRRLGECTGNINRREFLIDIKKKR